MEKLTIMKDYRARIDKLVKMAKQDTGILAVFLFGSTTRSDYHQTSDVEICLILKPDHHTPLELSRKRLEYLNLSVLDVRIFQQLPLYVRMGVIKEGKNLFNADEDALYQLVFDTISEFEDFEDSYRDYLKDAAGASLWRPEYA